MDALLQSDLKQTAIGNFAILQGMQKQKWIRKMGHVAIQVEDLSRSLEFYRDCLGLEGSWTEDSDWANLQIGGDDLSLVKKEGARHPPHFGFYVSGLTDLQSLLQELREKGVRVGEVTKHRDSTHSFYFRDPDGHILEAIYDPRQP